MKTERPWTFRSITRVDCCYLGSMNQVMPEICQTVLAGFGMPVECFPSIVVPIFKKCDIMICSCSGAVKLLEHAMKFVEMVLEKNIVCLWSAIWLMPLRGTIDAEFILRMMQEEYHAKAKFIYLFCQTRKIFCQSTEESVGMAIRKKGIKMCWLY